MANSPLGDKPPSARLAKIRDQVTDENLIHVSLSQLLPDELRLHFAAKPSMSLDELGKTVNHLMEFLHSKPSTSSTPCLALSGPPS